MDSYSMLIRQYFIFLIFFSTSLHLSIFASFFALILSLTSDPDLVAWPTVWS